jgi:hypothetical protein
MQYAASARLKESAGRLAVYQFAGMGLEDDRFDFCCAGFPAEESVITPTRQPPEDRGPFRWLTGVPSEDNPDRSIPSHPLASVRAAIVRTSNRPRDCRSLVHSSLRSVFPSQPLWRKMAAPNTESRQTARKLTPCAIYGKLNVHTARFSTACGVFALRAGPPASPEGKRERLDLTKFNGPKVHTQFLYHRAY